MLHEYASPEQALSVAKRAVYLAWQACGGPVGMGVHQDRGDQTEGEVWAHAADQRDYPGKPKFADRVSCDYVMGRMMKLYFRIEGKAINVPESVPRGDYQSWCHTYPTYDSLFAAATEEVTRC